MHIACSAVAHAHAEKTPVLLTNLLRLRWLYIGLVFFCVFIELDYVLAHKNAKKNFVNIQPSWPRRLINNAYIKCKKNIYIFTIFFPVPTVMIIRTDWSRWLSPLKRLEVMRWRRKNSFLPPKPHGEMPRDALEEYNGTIFRYCFEYVRKEVVILRLSHTFQWVIQTFR